MRASLFLTILAPAAGIESVTPTLLDTPADATYPSDVYPRSIWALRAWAGYLFAGTGDSAHNVTAPPIWNSTDGETWSDTDGVSFTSHQLDRFVLTGGVLHALDHDPTSGTTGSLYTHASTNTWNKSTPVTLSACAHVYDMLHDLTYLWAAVGASSGSNSIRRSSDNGLTWSPYAAPGSGMDVTPSRSWTFFTIDGVKYCSTNYAYYTSPPAHYGVNDPWVNVVKWNGSAWVDGGVQFAPNDTLQVQYTEVEPEVFEISSVGRIAKAVTFGSQVFYIVGETVTDHDFSPTNLYSVTAALTPTRLTFMGGAKVHDLLVHNNACYALCNELSGDTYTTTVYVTSDGTSWTGALTFRHSDTYTYARSMAFFDDGGGYDLYFGYACYYDQEGAGAGKIVRTALTQIILFAGGGSTSEPAIEPLLRVPFTSDIGVLTETDSSAVGAVSGGQYAISGTPAVGSGLLYNTLIARAKGRVFMFATPTGTAATNRIRVGWSQDSGLGAVNDDYIITGIRGFRNINGEYDSGTNVLQNYEAHALVLDTTGCDLYTYLVTDTAKPGFSRRLRFTVGNAANLYVKGALATNAGVSQTWKMDEWQVWDLGATFGDSETEVSQASPVSGTTYTCSGDSLILWTVTAPNPLSGSASIKFRNVDANNYMIARFNDSGTLIVERVASGSVATTPISVASVASAGATLTVMIPMGLSNNDGQVFTIASGTVTKRGSNFDTTSALASGANVIPEATDWTLGQLTVYDNRDTTAYDQELSQMMNLVIWDGDSITAGSSATTGNDYGRVATKSLWDAGTIWYQYNVAVGGQTMATMAADVATDISGWYSSTRPAQSLKQIVFCFAGTNDFATGGRTLAQLQADVQTYCAAVRAAGLKVIVCTIIARNNAGLPGDFETNRGDYNTWLAANYSGFADGLADFAADAAFNEQSDADNTTNYNADKVHPNTTGHAILAGIAKTAIDAVAA